MAWLPKLISLLFQRSKMSQEFFFLGRKGEVRTILSSPLNKENKNDNPTKNPSNHFFFSPRKATCMYFQVRNLHCGVRNLHSSVDPPWGKSQRWKLIAGKVWSKHCWSYNRNTVHVKINGSTTTIHTNFIPLLMGFFKICFL